MVCCGVLQCVAGYYRVSSKNQKDRERLMFFLLFIPWTWFPACAKERERENVCRRQLQNVSKCVCERGLLQCVAVCCSVLQCVAVCCSVLQCAVVCCSVLHCLALFYIRMKQKVSECVCVYL